MHVLNDVTNEQNNNYSNTNFNSAPVKTYLYCKDADKKPFYYQHLIYARKIELINNYFGNYYFTAEATAKKYLFDLNTLDYNLQNPELLIEKIASRVKKNINVSDIPVNFGISLLIVAISNFVYMFMIGNHKKGEDAEQYHKELSRLVFNGVLLTAMQISYVLVSEKFNSLYAYTYAIRGVKRDNSFSFLLKVADNESFSIKYPFQHIDIAKIIYIIKDELNYNYNEITEIYKMICLSVMELWIEDNLLIDDSIDITTKLIQKIITLIIKNNRVRESILFSKAIAIPFKQAVNCIKTENNPIKIDSSQNITTTEQQENILTSMEAGFYSVLGSNLLLYIKNSFLGKKIYKIYHPLLQVEVSTNSENAVNELFKSTANEIIFKKII